jgi:hypothetical protein
MMSSRSLALFAFASLVAVASAAEPIYKNDFESAAVGKPPEGAMVISGDFVVKQEAGGKFLELPGEPLDTFGLLVGPAGQGDLSASARIFGTKKGRKFPAFGISLGGVGGYRLVVSAGKKTLEIFKGDEVKTSVPFDWTSDAWTTLRLQVRKTADGCVVEGKAWASDGTETAAWLIRLEEKSAPPQGRAGVWGSPYSGTPIRFDEIVVAPAS